MRVGFSVLYVLVFASFTYSQTANRAVVSQPMEWFSLSSTMKVRQGINIYAEANFRFVQAFEPMQYQIRVAGEYVVSKKLSVAPIAYVYTPNFQYGEQPASYANNEHRIFQQIMYKHSAGKCTFNHRIRIEERFIQVHTKNPAGEVVDEGFTNNQIRLRHRAIISYPLNKPKIEPGAFFASVYDELFISWGKRITFHRPDQNRVYAGLGYQFNNDFSLQAGFLYQMLIKANGTQQENNMGLMAQLNHNFDFTRKGN